MLFANPLELFLKGGKRPKVLTHLNSTQYAEGLSLYAMKFLYTIIIKIIYLTYQIMLCIKIYDYVSLETFQSRLEFLIIMLVADMFQCVLIS